MLNKTLNILAIAILTVLLSVAVLAVSAASVTPLNIATSK